MYTIKLNGANAEKVAELIGATIIVHNESNDTITVSGGDPTSLLCQECQEEDSVGDTEYCSNCLVKVEDEI